MFDKRPYLAFPAPVGCSRKHRSAADGCGFRIENRHINGMDQREGAMVRRLIWRSEGAYGVVENGDVVILKSSLKPETDGLVRGWRGLCFLEAFFPGLFIKEAVLNIPFHLPEEQVRQCHRH